MNYAVFGAVFALLAVALGAFGAHALRRRMEEAMLSVFQTGVQYQMYHALALIAAGIISQMGLGGNALHVAGWLFIIGIVLFSGSLYLLAISRKKVLGAITPVGGVCFLAGWVLFIIGIA